MKDKRTEIEDDFKDMLILAEYSLKKFWNNKEDEIWNSI